MNYYEICTFENTPTFLQNSAQLKALVNDFSSQVKDLQFLTVCKTSKYEKTIFKIGAAAIL